MREEFVIIIIVMMVMTTIVTASCSNIVEAIPFVFRFDGVWSFHLFFAQ
jgi:hypothetical protein